MAGEWVSPVVSGAVGLGGIVLGCRVAAGSRKHEVGQWHREQRADAYVELLEVAKDVGHYVALTLPSGPHPSDSGKLRAAVARGAEL